MEKIVEIKEVTDFKLSKKSGSIYDYYNGYDGYRITTDKHEYHLLISNKQLCCESWGYFESNDNMEEFIGSKLLGVKLTDTALNTNKIKDEELEYGFDGGCIQFVDFETDKGMLQIAVYNCHNGYYGHDIIFVKDNNVLKNDVL